MADDPGGALAEAEVRSAYGARGPLRAPLPPQTPARRGDSMSWPRCFRSRRAAGDM